MRAADTVFTKKEEMNMFVLAGAGVDLATKIAMKDMAGAARVVNLIAQVIGREPEFMAKFRRAQEQVMKNFNEMAAD